MKTTFLFAFVLLFIAGCNKQLPVDNDTNLGHGYNSFKYGAATNTLIAGKTIDVGTVIININDTTDVLEVIYETNADWRIRETHVFVGYSASEIPLNKPGNPKVGRFPYHVCDHGDDCHYFVYPTLDFISDQQFVVAAHAKVINVNTGVEETAWAFNETTATKFSGKRWGWFINYQYLNIPLEEATILYATECRADSVNIYHINMATEEATLISSEVITSLPDESYNGNAWDSETNTFYFTTFPNGDLWSNDMDEEEGSEEEGELEGEGGSGTVYEGDYYYVDDEENELMIVEFDEEGDIVNEEPVDIIDITSTVQDITISSDGLFVYGVGDNLNGTSQFFKFDLTTGETISIATINKDNIQIAFGEDGTLYAVDSTDGAYGLSTLDTETGELIFLFSLDIAFCDLATGPKI